MKASSVKRHLEKLGVTMEKISPLKDGRRWSTKLNGPSPETALFSKASHALRYWDARSRAQVPLLVALEARVRSGITLEDIADLEQWVSGNQACPDFVDRAFRAPQPSPYRPTPRDITKLCATYGPISSPWIKSFAKLARAHLGRNNKIDLNPKWMWGTIRGNEKGN